MRAMLAQAHGSIVNLSSTMGSRGAAGASMYVASKHAVEGLTKAAALEGAAHGIRVNAVAPGPVETELLNRFAGSAEKKAALAAGVPMKRLGTPEDIASTIVFLASDKAEFLTGQVIGVNGGKTAF
jgi:NAD(P)-dependent dehydrogenase (short-subunit alcohol dehydrogenase family)